VITLQSSLAVSYGGDFPRGTGQPAATRWETRRETPTRAGDYLVALATLCHHEPTNHASCLKRTEDRSLDFGDHHDFCPPAEGGETAEHGPGPAVVIQKLDS
jgi:hypothetical protein